MPAHELASYVGGVPTNVDRGVHRYHCPLLSPRPGDTGVQGVRTPELILSGGCRTPELVSVTHQPQGEHHEH